MKNKSEFLISGIETGQLNSMVKKVMFQANTEDPKETVRMINSGELFISKWFEKNGVIYFSVVSNGFSGEQWIDYFKRRGIHVSSLAKKVLRSPKFKPTKSVIYKVAVLKDILFNQDGFTPEEIKEEANTRGFRIPNYEIACLIREKFLDSDFEKMGVNCWTITVMSDLFEDDNSSTFLLKMGYFIGDSIFDTAHYYGPDYKWKTGGYAFLVS